MEFSQIHNYYEHLVFEQIDKEIRPKHAQESDDYFLDMACVALNQLPVRYMRHEVDMAFFLDSGERETMVKEVSKALSDANTYLKEHYDSRR